MNSSRLRGLLRLRLLPAALIALLLFAQLAALGHALLHVAHHGDTAAHAHVHEHAHDGDASSGEASANCGFDLLYSEVLGGVHGGSCSAASGAAGVVLVAAGGGTAAGTAAVPYDSRAPPAFS